MLNNCSKKKSSNSLVFMKKTNEESELKFIQNLEYKLIELMSLPHKKSTTEIIEAHIKFRYFKLQQKIIFMQEKYEFIFNLVKVKNPSLLLQIQNSFANMFDNSDNFFEI